MHCLKREHIKGKQHVQQNWYHIIPYSAWFNFCFYIAQTVHPDIDLLTIFVWLPNQYKLSMCQCIDQSRSQLQMTWIDIISSYQDTYEAQIQTADEKKNERLYFL